MANHAAFASFLQASPSSYHAAAVVASELEDLGFLRLSEAESWGERIAAGGSFVVVRDGAVIAWSMPSDVSQTTPLRIIGSHTDSPGFKLKPTSTFEAHGFAQLAVEVYGGPILDTWFDRELEFAGRLVDSDGQEHLVRSGAIARIPQLAIHLDRSANDTRTVDRQRHTQPILGVSQVDVVAKMARSVGLTAHDVAGFDLISVDAQPAAAFGAEDPLFASGRLDNLTSVFASLQSLKRLMSAGGPSTHIAMIAAFDHEELGSESRSGASGPFLADVLERVSEALGATRDERAQAYAASWCVSADAAHSVHPNFADKHDPNVKPILGGGPVLKLNANQRYATDAHGSAFWRERSARASVPVQEFVSNNQIPAGSTIGPLAATRLGIRTLDVGIPLLSMHSARELCHLGDLEAFTDVLTACFD
jgi:aspartyl aminopeptidase